MKRVLAVAIMSSIALAPAALAGSGKKLDAGSLVTILEMEKIIGKLRNPPKPDTDVRGYSTCDFTNEEGANLKLLVYSSDNWNAQKGAVSEKETHNLSQLGDEAFWVKRGSILELYAKQGNEMLEIDSTISGGVEAPKKVAALVLKKLK